MSPFGSVRDEDGWFRVSTVEVTTTVFVTAMCVASFFVYAVSKSMIALLAFDAWSVRYEGGIWRLITWPFANVPNFSSVLAVVMFYVFGRELEQRVGRRPYLWVLAILTLIPAAVVTPISVVLEEPVLAFGVGGLVDGLILIFLLVNPTARSFFGIPFWVIAAVFWMIRVLQLLGDRLIGSLAFFGLTLLIAAVLARAFDLTPFHQIPRISLPQAITGQARTRSPRRAASATVTPIRRGLSQLEQAELDVLLERVSAVGTKGLTNHERQRLEVLSRQLRGDS